jgi:prepilin-type N-terminal cleavage/methylation domain-containing protein
MKRSQQQGLTLPEVLIALLVFSAIAATSVYALRLGVDSRDQLARVDDELKSFQLARTLIKEDMAARRGTRRRAGRGS